MSSYLDSDRKSLVPVLVILALLVLTAAALWYVSWRLSSPLTSAEGSSVEGYRHVRSVYGNGPDRLHRPTEVAVDFSGNVYVADSYKHRVMVFSSSGAFVKTIGGPANVEGALRYPSAVSVDARGRVYVISSSPSRVVIYNVDGSVINEFEVDEPQTLALSTDRLYITTRNGILIGDLDGNQAGQLSGFGSEPGRIDRPTGLAIGQDGIMYVADSLNYRFQAIDSAGEPLWVSGDPIEDTGVAVRDDTRTYGLPSDITIGSDGLLYAIDAFNGEILVFDTSGEQIAMYGDWGRLEGQFYYPSSIAEVRPELFVVADTFNDRIQFIRIPSPAPTPAMQARRALPWLAGLAALALVLLFARRPVRVVTDAAGLRRADELGVTPDLLEKVKTLWVPEGTADEVTDLLVANEELAPALREVSIGDIDGDRGPAIELALRLRGRLGLRRVAVAFPGPVLAESARKQRIGVLDAEDDRSGSPDTQAA